MEGDSLKSIHGDAVSGRQIRDMLAETWKHLSSDDKLVYIEASNKDKERYLRELAAYEEHKRQQRNQPQNKTNRAINISDPAFINFTKPPREIVHECHMISRHSTGKQKVVESVNSGYTKKDDDYHAALEPDDDYEIGQISNESVVQMAFGLMKNAQPHDLIFDIDWEA
ncbi:putative high mobility group B protein 11 isoform X2 [Tanacetum coccineum]